jgi:hypothetical protein
LEGVAPAEQFPVNPRELVQAFQQMLVGFHPVARLQDLGGLFEQQGSHLPLGQATAQIEERPVLLARLAVAIRPATFKEALQKGGVQGLGREGESVQEVSFALTQGESREVFELVLTHNMSKIALFRLDASQNENARSKRKCCKRG